MKACLQNAVAGSLATTKENGEKEREKNYKFWNLWLEEDEQKKIAENLLLEMEREKEGMKEKKML